MRIKHLYYGRGIDYLLMIQLLENDEEKLIETASKYNNEAYYAEYEKVLKTYLNINRDEYKEFLRL